MKKYFLLLFAITISTISYSQINVGTNFAIISPNPIDSRMVVADTNARNSIVWKYNGQLVYVITTQKFYSWNLTNWTPLNSATPSDTLQWLTPAHSFKGYYVCGVVEVVPPARFIASATSGTWTVNNVYECIGSTWTEHVAVLGDAIALTDSGKVFVFNGTSWENTDIANTNYWAKSGTNLFNINAGNVGINTVSPSKTFEVNGSSNFQHQAYFQDTVRNYSYTRQTYTKTAPTADTLNYTVMNYMPTSYLAGINSFNVSKITLNILKSDTNKIRFSNMSAINAGAYNTNDSVLGNTQGGGFVGQNNQGYAKWVWGVGVSSGLFPVNTRAKTDNLIGVGGHVSIIPTNAVNSLAIASNVNVMYGNSTIGGFYTTTVDSVKAFSGKTQLTSRTSGKTTTIGKNVGLYYELSQGTHTVGANIVLTNNYGLELQNKSGHVGSINDYGIYENFGKNYFTNTVYSLGGYLSDANGTSRFGTNAGNVNAGLHNTFIGDSAGFSNSIGSYNTFVGWKSGLNNTIGEKNEFFGKSAGGSNVDGNYNVFVGYTSGLANTSGSQNTYIGHESGLSNKVGVLNYYGGYKAGMLSMTSNNVMIGAEAGINNTNGALQTFVGRLAGYTNIDGLENTFIGAGSGYANSNQNYNSYVGTYSGYGVNGSDNTFIGYQTAYQNGNGAGSNVGVGTKAGFNIGTSARYNAFLGAYAGYNNSGAEQNTMVGQQSGYNNSGNNNTFLGSFAGFTNTSSVDNTFVGKKAGYSNIASSNTFLGTESGYSNTSGTPNTFIGFQSGYSNVSGVENTFLGYQSGHDNLASYNTFTGYNSGHSNSSGTSNSYYGYGSGANGLSGLRNSFFGTSSGTANTGSDNTFMGANCGYLSQGSFNSFMGVGAGYNNTGSNNVFNGYNAGYNNTGNENIFVGYSSGNNNTSGGNNIFFGTQAGLGNTTGEKNVLLGGGANSTNTIGSNNTFIGFTAGEGGIINHIKSNSTGIGFEALHNDTSDNNVAVGYQAGYSNTSGTPNTFIGYQSGYSNVSGAGNTTLGYQAGYDNISGNTNSFFGYSAGKGTLGDKNTYIGSACGLYNAYGLNNTAVGNSAGRGVAGSTRTNLTAIGSESFIVDTSDFNTGLGSGSGRSNTSGSANTYLGYRSGYWNVSGSSNVFIGYKVGSPYTATSNKLAIDNDSVANPLIEGDFLGDSLTINGTFINPTSTITDNDLTPDVSGRNIWTYNGTVTSITITNLDNAVVGAEYTIIGNSDTYTISINDGGNFHLSGGVNFTMGQYDNITLRCVAVNTFIEVKGRNDN